MGAKSTRARENLDSALYSGDYHPPILAEKGFVSIDRSLFCLYERIFKIYNHLSTSKTFLHGCPYGNAETRFGTVVSLSCRSI